MSEPQQFLVWRHKNGRVYKRRLRWKTFKVPKNAVHFQVVVSTSNPAWSPTSPQTTGESHG